MTKHRRGPWSQAEDQYLLSLVHSQGAHNWVRISQLINSRSPKQCRERYHQNLKPSLNLEPISSEEGALIEQMVNDMGKRWAEIARRLHGRSDNAVKNWWNGGMNRRKRLDNRRADAAARQQPAYMSAADPRHVAAHIYSNGLSAPPPAPTAPHYQHAHFPVDPRTSFSAVHMYPNHLQTSHLGMPPRRSIVDTPLPSPGAVSTQSHADSVDGTAPSLVSDMGSYQSQSPNSPVVHKELPPLGAISAADTRHMSYPVPGYEHTIATQDYRRLSYASPLHVDHTGQTYAIDPALNAQSKAMLPPQQQQHQQHQQQPYWSTREQQQQQLQHERGPASGPQQLPLPPFHSVTSPGSRYHSGPPSPPRDSRMNLKSVLQ